MGAASSQPGLEQEEDEVGVGSPGLSPSKSQLGASRHGGPPPQQRSWGKSRSMGNMSQKTDDTCMVQVKVMPLMQSKSGGDAKSYKISSLGAVLQGGMAPEIRDVAREFEKQTTQSLDRIFVDDRRAQQLLVSYVGDDFYVVPAPELFSRHTGACRILGDKNQRTTEYALQVGDFLRIGSVGLVVSEMHTGEGQSMVLSEGDLAYLREDVGEIWDDFFATDEAATAADEAAGKPSPSRSPRLPQCYMCFDDEDSTDNPLVAPCLCKGGTRYVHLECLQKWQAAAGEEKDCVVSTAEIRNTCKVCKSRYKTHVRATDGRLLPLMVHQLPPPYICFLIVTRHETAEELFNTQFQLSFAEQKQVVIGRSRNCDMVLDYRTVSTQHATVTFKKGAFVFRDLNSSNGSMLNLRRPLKLPWNQWIRIRYGRSIVALKAKRSWVRRKLSALGGSSRALDVSSRSGSDASTPREASPGGHLRLLQSLCTVELSPRLHSPQGEGGDSRFLSFHSDTMSPSMGGGARAGGSAEELDESEDPEVRPKPRPGNFASQGRSQSLNPASMMRRHASQEAPMRRGPSFTVPPSPLEESDASQLST